MPSREENPERKLIVERPSSLQTQGGSVNLAFTQEDNLHNKAAAAAPGDVRYAMYSPLSEDGCYSQLTDGPTYVGGFPEQLIQSSTWTGQGRHNGTAANFSINPNRPVNDDFVMEKKASVVSRDSSNDGVTSNHVEPEETIHKVFIQMIGPLIASGFGTVAAGLLLVSVLQWKNFIEIPELVTLVPVLLGLKGNLEMTLTARLCTAANLGNMGRAKDLWAHVFGNLVVTQLQAIVVSSVASVISVAIYSLQTEAFILRNTFVLLASTLLTASLASLLLGLLMSAIVILSRRFNLNPDNISAPIAASVGDILTLALLANISAIFYNYRHQQWLAPLVILHFLAPVPLWVCAASKNHTVRSVLTTGWVPILCAMVISMGAGKILEMATECYKLMAIFQPVIAGVGGNLVVVQTCRMTTLLGRRSRLGIHPEEDNRSLISPLSALFGKHYLSRTARLLLLVTVPGQTLFVYVIHLVQSDVVLTPLFLFFYLTSAVLQVAILLYMARCVVYCMWSLAVDPDNAAIPILTAVGDFLGSGLLAVSLVFLHKIGDRSVTLNEGCLTAIEMVNSTLTTAASSLY